MRDLTSEEERAPVLREHKHVDNGGVTVVVDCYGNVTLQASYQGYYDSSLLVGPHLDWLIDKLTEAKYKVRDLHERLKKEDPPVKQSRVG